MRTTGLACKEAKFTEQSSTVWSGPLTCLLQCACLFSGQWLRSFTVCSSILICSGSEGGLDMRILHLHNRYRQNWKTTHTLYDGYQSHDIILLYRLVSDWLLALWQQLWLVIRACTFTSIVFLDLDVHCLIIDANCEDQGLCALFCMNLNHILISIHADWASLVFNWKNFALRG